MNKNEKSFSRFNFHMHTNASDGRNSVEEVVAALADANVEWFSVTDHNTVASIKKAKLLAKQFRIRFVSGVELTAKLPLSYGAHYYAHVLGYGIDEELLSKRLTEEKTARVESMYALLLRLRKGGFDLFSGKSKEELPLLWSVAVFASQLLKSDYALTEQEAYEIIETFGGREVPDFPSVSDTLRTIREAGGIAVWAHPYDLVGCVKKRIEDSDVLSVFNEVFTDADGIEVYYQDFSSEQIRTLETFADARGLLKTVGTDFHGLPKKNDSPSGRNSLFFSKDGCAEYGEFAKCFDESGSVIGSYRYENKF